MKQFERLWSTLCATYYFRQFRSARALGRIKETGLLNDCQIRFGWVPYAKNKTLAEIAQTGQSALNTRQNV